MRGGMAARVLAIGVLLATGGVTAGCRSGAERASGAPAWVTGTGVDADATSTAGVCANVRRLIAADMAPLGTALGTMLGHVSAHSSSGTDQARAAVAVAVRKIGTDITSATGTAADPDIRTAGATAGANVRALAEDPALLDGVTSTADIGTVTDRLTTASAPLATACR